MSIVLRLEIHNEEHLRAEACLPWIAASKVSGMYTTCGGQSATTAVHRATFVTLLARCVLSMYLLVQRN